MNEIAPHPRKAATVIGHDAASAALDSAAASGRLPHAWLLAGPRGIGKATLAYRFARTLLAARTADPLVAAGAHPDLVAVERSLDPKRKRFRDEIVVDDVRALLNFFAHTPAEGGWRVAVVDAADELNSSAANSLLKILEEPPERGLLLLVAHRPGMVLPTVRSRCRPLRMGRLSDDDVRAVLSLHWPELPPDAEAGLVVLAEGSPGRAVTLGEVDGYGTYRELVALLETLPQFDVAAMHRFADRLAGREAAPAFRLLADLPAWWLVRMIRAGAGHPPTTEVVPGETGPYRQLLARRSLEQWVGVWERLSLLVARGAALNLDRKQIALDLLTSLGRAAGV